jgi:ATP-dependent helicase/nuclease subunit A
MSLGSPEQLIAADPDLSVWVAANAGSGKTTVLAKRVVRLLLAGNDPARILCLTFTKAAAANMQNRVFADELGKWVSLDDAALSQAIEGMTGARPTQGELRRARRLFAKAVETPGGLKIQTIHGFCERLLHLFPFEAGVPARFSVMEEREQLAATEAAINATLAEALAEPEGLVGRALRLATETAAEGTFRESLRAFMAHRRDIEARALERKYAVSPLRARLGVQPGETVEGLRQRIVGEGLYREDWRSICAWLRSAAKARDIEIADLMTDAYRADGRHDVEGYIRCFLNAEGKPRADRGWFISADLRKQQVEHIDRLIAERERIVALMQQLQCVEACERSEAIALLADEVNARYRAEKRRLARLDFPDLIGKVVKLLRADAARWVLYKLDQGLDHILVDEAQDTSPEQWRIVKALADDFFSGEGARGDRRRTIFAVGDEKQSIFGFQGARPEQFDASYRHFAGRIAAYNEGAAEPHGFRKVPLQISYRTVDDILSCVDQIFSREENYRGLSSENQRTVHRSNRQNQPGLVELWTPIVGAKTAERDPFQPLDSSPPDAPAVKLARKVARRIDHWLRTEARFDCDGRHITAGDVLVLVRSRGALFDNVIRELRQAGVPVAGADRMKLMEQIAVMDLLALGRFCLLPEDDLTLAALLKSPLVGLDEDDLMALAHGRGPVSLWDALQAAAAPRFAEAVARLGVWRERAMRLDPFAFYADVLGAGGGRRHLVGRLGPDSEEAINVFQATLRQWQSANPPSLLGFLEAMAASEADVKRDMEEGHGRVRVMTVHASKGLEARVVFLVDTYHSPKGGGSGGPRLLEIEEGDAHSAVWVKAEAADPPQLQPARQRLDEAVHAESRRLLYVALTRAKDRLYICGARGDREHKGHWRGIIDAALDGHEHCAAAPCEHGDEDQVIQWRTVKAPPAKPQDRPPPSAPSSLPDWLRLPAAPDLPRPPPLRPSRLADAAEPPAVGEVLTARATARLRGELVHHLLQHLPDLPPERRGEAAIRLAAARFPALDEAARAEAIGAAQALMADPFCAPLFDGEARAEVEIAGKIRIGGRAAEVAGRIDRLAIRPDRVVLMDFKTGRPPRDPADVPERHLKQLAIYQALLADLYPGRAIEAAVVWTALPAAVAIPRERLAEAMAAITLP